jgi:hypothetical protein
MIFHPLIQNFIAIAYPAFTTFYYLDNIYDLYIPFNKNDYNLVIEILLHGHE